MQRRCHLPEGRPRCRRAARQPAVGENRDPRQHRARRRRGRHLRQRNLRRHPRRGSLPASTCWPACRRGFCSNPPARAAAPSRTSTSTTWTWRECNSAISVTFNWNPSYSYAKMPEDVKNPPAYWRVLTEPVPPEKGLPHLRNVRITESESHRSAPGLLRGLLQGLAASGLPVQRRDHRSPLRRLYPECARLDFHQLPHHPVHSGNPVGRASVCGVRCQPSMRT